MARVLIEYVVDEKGAVSKIRQVKTAVTESGTAAQATGRQFRSMAGGLKLLAGSLAAVKLGQFVSDAVRQSSEQQRVFQSLAQTMKNAGASYNENARGLQNLFSALQQTTRYGDTDSARVLQRLVTVTHDYDASLKLLQPTLNMATAMNIDATTAADLLGKSVSGYLGLLGRYGIVLDDATRAELQHASAMERAEIFATLLNEKFGGSAQADLATYSGRVAQLGNYWSDLKEAMGDVVTQTSAAPGVFDKTKTAIIGVTKWMKDFGEVVVYIANFGAWDRILLAATKMTLGAARAFAQLFKEMEGFVPFASKLAKQLEAVQMNYGIAVLALELKVRDSTRKAQDAASAYRDSVENLSAAASSAAGGGLAEMGDAITETGKASDEASKAIQHAQELIFEGIEEQSRQLQESVDDWQKAGEASSAALDSVIDGLGVANYEIPKFAEGMSSEINKLGDSFGSLLKDALLGKSGDLEDIGKSIGRILADALGTEIADRLSAAITGKDANGNPISFWDALTGGKPQGTTQRVAQGIGGGLLAYQGFQQGGALGGITSGLGTYAGLMAIPGMGVPVAAAVAAVSALVSAIFGGQKSPPTPTVNWGWSPTGGAAVTGSNVPSGATASQFQTKINETISAVYSGFLDALEKFGTADVFKKIALAAITGTSHTRDLTAVFTEILNTYLPGQIQNQVAGAFYAAFGGAGASGDFVTAVFGQANQFGGDRRVEFIQNVVQGVVDLAKAAKALSSEEISFDVSASSIERFGKGIGDIVDQISVLQARMDAELDIEGKAKDASRIAALVREARQAEIQMLQQIDALQKNIQQSIAQQIEGLYLGGLTPGAQNNYLQAKLGDFMGLLRGATSPEDVQYYVGQIQQYVNQLAQVLGPDLYQQIGAGFGGTQTWSEYLIQILQDAQDAADTQLQGMRDAVKEKNDALLDALGDAAASLFDLSGVIEGSNGAGGGTGSGGGVKDRLDDLARAGSDAADALRDLAGAARGGGGGMVITIDGSMAPLVGAVDARLAAHERAMPLGRV